MRDYVELYFAQNQADTKTSIGRTVEEAQYNNPGPYKNAGKFYVLLDKDRVALIAAAYFSTVGASGQLRRAVLGQNLSVQGLGNIATMPGGFQPDEIVVFDSPRPYFSHDSLPASWRI